jgi:hypothetical protein
LRRASWVSFGGPMQTLSEQGAGLIWAIETPCRQRVPGRTWMRPEIVNAPRVEVWQLSVPR